MSDNIFSAVLTFSLMAAGTIAVGSEMMSGHRPAATPSVCVTLDPVTVIGKRPTVVVEAVTLPMVTVTGRRSAWAEVAADTHGAATTVE